MASIPPASLRDFLRRHRWPAVLFLQEVKIANTDKKTQEAVQKAVNDRSASESLKGPTYEVYFNLPTDRFNARGLRGSGKVYGVCSIIRTDLSTTLDITPKVRMIDWDKEGRVSTVEISSQSRQMFLAIFNIYAVNGTDNPYHDPLTGAMKGTRHDRKLEFHKLLMQECLTLEKAGWNVVLAGDMNVAPAQIDGHPNLRTFPHQHVLNRIDFLQKFLQPEGQSSDDITSPKREKSWQGVDVWRAMNHDTRRYTYYPRSREWGSSCDRIDYVIASKKLWDMDCIPAAGILDNEAERGPSDHVPIWLDITLDSKCQDSK